MSTKLSRLPYVRDITATPAPNAPTVSQNPYDRLENYFNGTPLPSTGTETVYNEIECKEVSRYARDSFDAIRSLQTARRLEAEKRSAEADKGEQK